jgi:hypothetical protein
MAPERCRMVRDILQAASILSPQGADATADIMLVDHFH